ncbi:MAG: DNA mismatch repair protein MutS [Candidatus Thorarchaeota archaeon]|nr:MAG: DNA mismatch repair protein MutS [Candidatus Thorarchaeota archaeon]
MQRQYLQLKQQYPDCLMLYRLGDFYELFNEDAKIASKILDIVLTARGEGVDKWPMCGVPHHSVDGYIAKLLAAGNTVAIADQVEDASKAKGLVKRDVVRVITPGTILEASMLEDTTNNYLTAIVQHQDLTGIASVDVSTGEFFATEVIGEPSNEQVQNELGRIGPVELLLPDSFSRDARLVAVLNSLGTKITYRSDVDFNARTAEDRVKEQFGVATLDGFGLSERKVALGATGAVLAYLQEVHKTSRITVTSIRTYTLDDHMVVDPTTQRNLELVKNARDGSLRGTLMGVLSKTVTPMGKRKLKQWILQPLRDIPRIEQRLDGVDELARKALTRDSITEKLRNTGDIERIVSRIVFGSAGARDLVALRDVLSRLPDIKNTLGDCESEILSKAANLIDPLTSLNDTLHTAVLDSPPVSVREGGMIREGFSKDLDRLKGSISEDKKWIASLQARERKRTGIKSLKVSYNKVFGYYIEVTKSNLDLVPDEYERKQTLTNAERFITPELKEKEASVLAGEEKINQLEYEIYEELRSAVSENLEVLRNNAVSLAIADVLVALSDVAVTRKYIRPKLTEGTRIKIVDGRHPALEMILGSNEFVPNSLDIGDGGTTLVIATGPNMSGKSTYMRQAAQIVLLAQMGSFVPAKSAEVGLVDRIFTRVGAFDDLTARQSTFMVEMIETANILNNATDRSLVVLDEIGRGTSTFDGMALAWAVAEQIVLMKTRTLFATHFHQLTEMASAYHGVKNVHTLAKEAGDKIVFLHKVVEGGTDRSYGVHVAALAGVPDVVVKRAKRLLARLEKEQIVDIGKATEVEAAETLQTTLESLTLDDPIVEKILNMDLERTTAIEALLKLKEMQDEIKSREKQ